MTLLVRILIIAFGFLAACFVASAIIVATWLFPAIFDTAFSTIYGNVRNFVLAAGFVVVTGLALLPALLLIVITEMFSIRNAPIYALSGAVAGLSAYLSLQTGAAQMAEPIVRRSLEIVTGAGIAGGFVYWLIAGRNAGRWREPAISTASPPRDRK